MVKISQPLSDFLNLIRWIAAFLVLIGHIRGLVFINYEVIESKNKFLQFFYFITSLGHEAVIVFFVLSGFLVGGKLWQEIKEDVFQWKKYLIKRVTRLYVVLVPALIVGGLLDYIGLCYFNDRGIYTNAFYLSSLNYDAALRLNVEAFIFNIFMLQESFSTTFGSNGPLWSLAYEFWYYILFPILLLLILHRKNKVNFALYLMLFVLLLYSLNLNIIIYFSIWILGAIIFLYKREILSIKYSITIFVLVLFLVKLKIIFPYQLGDIIIAISLGLLIQSFKSKQKVFRFSKLNHLFADFSFSLYLIHYPFILLIIAFLLTVFNFGIKMQPSLESFTLFFILLFGSYLYAYVFYLIFEKQTKKIRIWLEKRMDRSR